MDPSCLLSPKIWCGLTPVVRRGPEKRLYRCGLCHSTIAPVTASMRHCAERSGKGPEAYFVAADTNVPDGAALWTFTSRPHPLVVAESGYCPAILWPRKVPCNFKHNLLLAPFVAI